MISRRRERFRFGTSGSVENDGILYPGGPEQEYYKDTRDFIGKIRRFDGTLPPSDFSSYTLDRRKTITIHGNRNIPVLGGDPTYFGGKVFLGTWNDDPQGGWVGPMGEMTDSELVAQLLSSSNPFAPTVSVPVMVSELVEATSLFKLAFTTFWTIIGSAWLNYVFGWRTMINDIRTLSQITQTIEQRVREYNMLIETGGLPKRSRDYVYTFKSYDLGVFDVDNRFSFGVKAKGSVSYSSRIWATCRWKPAREKVIPVDKLGQFNLAVRQVLDLELPDPATIWEAIPFSWLVDYFISVGPALQAIEGSDMVKPYDICVMRERRSVYHYSDHPQYNNKGVRVKPGVVYVTRLNRAVKSDPSLVDLMRFGLLSESQAKNLIALILSRKRALR